MFVNILVFQLMLFYFKCWFHNETNFPQLEGVTIDALNDLDNVKLYPVNVLSL